MLAGQAIGNNVFDLMPASSVNSKTKSESASTNKKEPVSFDKLLSRTTALKKDLNKDSIPKSSSSKDTDKKTTKDVKASEAKASNSSDAAKKLMSNKAQNDQINQTDLSPNVQNSDPSQNVASVVKSVKEEVQKSLDISEEELVEMMQKFGFGWMDLLNPDTLKTLVLDQAGATDPSMLLTEDGLGQQLNQLLTNVNDLMQEAGINLEDAFREIEDLIEFHKIMDSIEEASLEVSEDAIEAKQQVRDLVETNKQDELKASKETDESKIQFTVVKEESAAQETPDSSMSSDSGRSDSQQNLKTETTMTNQFLDQMVKVGTEKVDFSENLREIHELRDIANQIIEKIKITIKPTQTSMDLTLNPEHLGKVALNITNKNGVLTASFTTQNEVAKEAIESQMQLLKDNLTNQGIKVEVIEVSVSDFDFHQDSSMGQETNQQQNGASGSKRPFRMDAGEDLTTSQTEETKEQVRIDSGSSIDYSA